MNLFFRKYTPLISTIALLVFSSATFAACRINNCEQMRAECYENGGRPSVCEPPYVQCMKSAGCPLP